ncbi:hypothetical protein FI667_g9474, partial [Globisporangium splendens]
MTSLRVLRLALFAALTIFLGAFQSTVSPSGGLANAQSARVRKAWRSYSDSEKKTFIGALQSAMESGMHYYFAEIHAARPTNDFAHGNCGFLLWHRKFLLAYENMLRAQGPSFKDVTLPYWNYFQDHDMNMAAGVACNSMVTCSKFLADLGGSSRTSPVKAVKLGSAGVVEGYCVANGVAKSACASPGGTKSGACDRCIVRGDWSSPGVFLPLSKIGILNSIRTISTSVATDPHDRLRAVLEGGFHADVHNTLGGTMRTMASPFDPVFFGHHGTIDLMHFMHNRCHYGKKDNKKFDVFSKCTVTTAAGAAYTINANTEILINYGNKPAENDPVIGKFFKGLGSTYADFANAEKLKSASNNYRYVVDDYFGAIFKSQGIVCPPGTFASESSPKHKHHKKHKHHEDDSVDEEGTVEVPVYEIVATLSTCGEELMERNPNMTELDVAIQESILECEATRQKSGHELEDYTPEFRQAFSMAADSHPQCYRLLNDVKNGAIKLEVSDFCRQEYGRLTGTNLTEGEFGKPLPPASGSDTGSDEYDSESDSYDSASGSEDDDSNADSETSSDDDSYDDKAKSAHLRVAVHIHTA